MLNHWLKNKPGSTDIYAANPYETQALSTMASNRVTPYPALQAINLENRKGIYNINQSGGYSGGQRQKCQGSTKYRSAKERSKRITLGSRAKC